MLTPRKRSAITLAAALLLIATAALLPCKHAHAQSQSAQAQTPAAAVPANLPQLIDITASTGIKFDHLSSPEQKYIVESMGGGLALIDYDRDGFPDIYLTNSQSVEMALAGKKSESKLYHNNHDGTFTDVTAKAGVAQPCWAQGVAVGDYNNDGWPDMLVTCFGGVVLYKNNGDGTFTDVTHESGIDAFFGKGMAVAFADMNGDGFLDAFVTNDTMPNFLFRNIGGKKFEEIAVASGVAYSPDGNALSGMGADFRDVNNDGLPDIWHTAVEHEGFPLYINQGSGAFIDANASSGLAKLTNRMTGWSNGIYDFDNDGWKDLFVARADVMDNIQQAIPAETYPEPNSVFRNLGNGKFEDVSANAGTAFQVPGAHRGAAFGDIFNTGQIDAVISSLNEPVKLFRNIGAGGQHWLLLRLVGTRSNRMGLGAQIRIVTPDGRSQWNEATTAVGYACSSDPRVHFGLGVNTLVKEIRIIWPSRAVQLLNNIPADQIVTIEEPQV